MKNNRFLVFVEEYKPEIEQLVGTGKPRAEACFLVNSVHGVFSRDEFVKLVLEQQQKEASRIVLFATIVFLLFVSFPLGLYKVF